MEAQGKTAIEQKFRQFVDDLCDAVINGDPDERLMAALIISAYHMADDRVLLALEDKCLPEK